ncbi:MAG: sigma-70 family RNA polymerase sigma factor, partial [Planctomycetota bacterium]|nr:sigma-70 family RNA polymerase sigma factor [Planctomycetota bacterium]
AESDSGSLDEDERKEIQQLRRRAAELVRDMFPERAWQMFSRVKIDGHSPKEVAEDLGVTPDAVRESNWRYRRRVREELGDVASDLEA